MSSRPTAILLEDMLDAIRKIQAYTKDLTAEEFLEDSKTLDAVIRNLEIIGEAAHRLPADFRHQHDEVKWKAIIGLRHRVIHGYFGVDAHIIWRIIGAELDHLATSIESLRADLQ